MKVVVFCMVPVVSMGISQIYIHAQNKAPSNAVTPVMVLSGTRSNVSKPLYKRVTTQKEWNAIWANHLGTTADNEFRPLAVVDFSRYMVIAVFRGEQFNVSQIDIPPLINSADAIVVRIDEVHYQTVDEVRHDRPYAFIVLEKMNKRIVLQENDREYKRDPPLWKEFAQIEAELQSGSGSRK